MFYVLVPTPMYETNKKIKRSGTGHQIY
jgi:hypothetical protein